MSPSLKSHVSAACSFPSSITAALSRRAEQGCCKSHTGQKPWRLIAILVMRYIYAMTRYPRRAKCIPKGWSINGRGATCKLQIEQKPTLLLCASGDL